MLSLGEIAFWSYVGGALVLGPVMLALVCFNQRPKAAEALFILAFHSIGWPVTIWLFRPDQPFSIRLARQRCEGGRKAMARSSRR
jgi:ferric iron reductase protein FhuF